MKDSLFESTNKLSDVKNIDGLIAFLKGRKHDFYHHFTTFSTLEKIISYKTWRFAPGEIKNDLHEYDEKNNMIIRKMVLSTSFSYGDEDNMAMWAMYCIPRNEAIRLTMTRDAVERLVQCARNDKECSQEVDNVCLHDVVYYQGYKDDDKDSNNMLICDHDFSKDIDKSIYKEINRPNIITGYIKNSAWKHEQESRITLFLKKKHKGDIFVSIKDDIDYILKNSAITFGPWTSDGLLLDRYNKVRKLLDNCNVNVEMNYLSKLKIDQKLFGNGLLISLSPFANKVNLRNPCPYENDKNASVTVMYQID